MITETENMVMNLITHLKDLHKFKKATLEKELEKIKNDNVRELEIIDILENDILIFNNYRNELLKLK